MGDKLTKLESILTGLGSAALGFSGGVDSTFLLSVAQKILREKCLAVIVNSAVYPADEFKFALNFIVSRNIRHEVKDVDIFQVPHFSDNPSDRCYHCKLAVFQVIKDTADEAGIANIIDGTNIDDLSDHRPGIKALSEIGVRSPLKEAGFSKAEIRELSREMEIPGWYRPSNACLASRIPYGERIDHDKLAAVAEAESLLRSLGFSGFRVRHHGAIARIELSSVEDIELILRKYRDQIIASFKDLGFKYTAVDLAGYRMGSLNEAIEHKRH